MTAETTPEGPLAKAPSQPAAPQPLAIVIGDLHLTVQDAPLRAAFAAFVASRRVRACQTLYIIGDLFDVWPGPAMVTAPDFAEELSALRELVTAGVRVVWFRGNRDFYFGGPDRANAVTRHLGVQTVADYLVEPLAGRAVYLCHGDLLCAADHRYQAMRRVLRSHLVTGLVEAIPLGVTQRLAAWGRRLSRAEIATKVATGVVMDLCPRALGRVAAGRGDLAARGRGRRTPPVETIICGHIHRPAVRTYQFAGHPVRVFVVGPWSPTSGPVWIEAAPNGELSLQGNPPQPGSLMASAEPPQLVDR